MLVTWESCRFCHCSLTSQMYQEGISSLLRGHISGHMHVSISGWLKRLYKRGSHIKLWRCEGFKVQLQAQVLYLTVPNSCWCPRPLHRKWTLKSQLFCSHFTLGPQQISPQTQGAVCRLYLMLGDGWLHQLVREALTHEGVRMRARGGKHDRTGWPRKCRGHWFSC